MLQRKFLPPMLVIGFLFFAFGFISWLNALLIPYFKLSLQLSFGQAMMVAFAFYISYFVMALPSSYIIERTGYKKAMVFGLFIMAAGALLFIPAAQFKSYPLFLLGLFIQATGLTLLQTAANPYVTILGPLESAASRMSLMGVCNKAAGALAPLILLRSITKSPNEIDEIKEQLPRLSATQADAILQPLSLRLQAPYAIIAIVLAVLGLVIFFSGLPDIRHARKEKPEKNAVFQYPHLILGIAAIFCSVSVEVLAVDSIISYAEYQGYPFLAAKYFATYTLIIMIGAYLLGIVLIPRYLSQRRALIGCACLGMVLTAGILATHQWLSVWNVAFLGFCNALIWPSIWPLALKDLGSFTERGSAFLIMGVAGGALTPLLFGAIANKLNLQLAYMVLLPLYLFLGYYGLKGCTSFKGQRKLLTAVFSVLILSLPVTRLCAQPSDGGRYPLIPYPAVLKPAKGVFVINKQTALVIPPETDSFYNEQAALAALLGDVAGAPVRILKTPADRNCMLFRLDPSLPDPESYKLDISPEKVTLSAKSSAGMFYAVETLRQLLPVRAKGGTAALPAVYVEDQPAFPWRGIMLDVARSFFSVGYLRKLADRMAMYKLNKLHLHLTDDQGWRIEIKKYPALTGKNSWREYNNMDSDAIRAFAVTGNPDFKIDSQHIKHVGGKTLYGGFYTQEEMRSLIRYAAERHVEIIPEIDMPGHMLSAINVFPFLACDSATIGWRNGFTSPICPCKEEVLNFAKDVFSEIADLFPSQYIHIGGDEVEKSFWEESPLCRAFMQEKGFTRPEQLQSYFNDYMVRFFRSKGKILVGWDEIVDGGIDSSALVMFWRPWAPKAPSKAVKNSNRVVMSPDGPLYFDAIPDRYTLPMVYHYNPLDTAYHFEKGRENQVMGVQGNLWSELLPSEKRADYMLMPRMTALAELGWTYRPLYDSYLQRLAGQYERWEALQINYRLPDLDEWEGDRVFTDSVLYFQSAPLPWFTLHFTTDGSSPTPASPVLRAPIAISHNLDLKLALFAPGGHHGDIYTLPFKKVQYLPSAKAAQATKPGLQCRVYKGQFSQTALIRGTPDTVLLSAGLVIPDFSKSPAFALRFTGYIDVPVTGVYTFLLSSDDGAVLRIDSEKLIDNDGLHGEKERGGQIALQKGLHSISLDYLQGGGNYSLDVQCGIGDGRPGIIPLSWYRQAQ